MTEREVLTMVHDSTNRTSGAVVLERLEADIVSMAADLAAAEAQWLLWIAEYDRLEGWAGWGCRSCAHWLNWKCGLSLHAAQERVRTAHALEGLPAVADAFVAGQLTYSKVRALTRAAHPGNEALLLDLALTMTASQLERVCAACRPAEPDADAGAALAQRSMTRRRLGKGITRIVVDLPDDSAQVVWAAVQRHVDDTVDALTSASETSRHHIVVHRGGSAAMRADGLVEIVDGTANVSPRDPEGDRESRPGYLHLVLEADRGPSADGAEPLVTLNGWSLSNPVARRWLCDIDGSVMVEDRMGVPVAEGSRQRIVPRAMR